MEFNSQQDIIHTEYRMVRGSKDMGEKKVDEHRGKQQEEYGLLYRSSANVGLFSYFIKFCGGLKHCERNNLVPVIDMKTHSNMYGRNGLNSWECFFEQPCGIGVDDLKDRKCTEIDVNPIMDYPNVETILSNGETIQDWRRIVRKYIRLKHENLEKYANPELERALRCGRVLGVLARGTDYTYNKPHAHPAQPSTKTIIHDAKMTMTEQGFDFVYLTTEDIDIQNEFKNAFDDGKLIVSKQEKLKAKPERKRLSNYDNIVGNVDFGLAYLKAIYDLSRCSGILAGRTSGTVGAKLLSQGYDYEYYYDLGNYP